MGAYLLETDPSFTTGQFFAFLLYANMFYEPVRQLVSINNMIAAGKASGERVFEILDEEVIITDPFSVKAFPKSDHSIQFKNVSFSYDSKKTLIHSLDFSLKNGSTTALVGPTGSGKSTLASLVLRYYDVVEGKILIGGTNIKNFSLSELRNNIGIVSQDPFLFDTTIKQNLLLASPNSTDDELILSLKNAKAWNFVNELPLGLETLIGERGVRLSMGEKQRLT